MTRARLDKRPADVAAMFDAVAERYDLLNDLLSLGQDRLWRSAVARLVDARQGDVVLDVAAGTGTSSVAFTSAGARCVACDFAEGMLKVGARRMRTRAAGGRVGPARVAGPRAGGARGGRLRVGGARVGRVRAGGAGVGRALTQPGMVSFVAGDALALPFADQTFDVVTISFGLRNVADPDAALAELLRVTRTGGRLVICEFSHLPVRVADACYQRYIATALPKVARLLSPNAPAYDYLAESIRHWPAQAELAGRIRAAGWSAVKWRNLSFGVVAVHVGRRPR